MTQFTPKVLTLMLGLALTSSVTLAAEDAKKSVAAPTATEAAAAPTPAPLVIPDPVATGKNGLKISKADYDAFVKLREEQGAPAPTTVEAATQLIDELVLQAVLVNQAKKNKLDQTPEFKARIAFITNAQLSNAAVKTYVDSHPITDEKLKESYDKQIAAISKVEYKAAHILVSSKEEAEKIIKDINDQKDAAKKLERFAQMAKDNSIDTGSAANGGDLGWFAPEMMVKEFSGALADMKKGDITEAPVKSQFGWHIIMLEDLRDKEMPKFEDVKEQLKPGLIQQSVQEFLDNIKKEADAKILIK